MKRTRGYGLLLMMALLTIVYVLSSSGKFHIVDETSMFAVTESVALRRDLDTNAIAWTQWTNSSGEVLGAFGEDGQVYSKKGPAPAFLAVPWYWLLNSISRANIELGQLQGTLLFNAFITAWTAALLWLTALRLGYGDRTGLALGLLFGLSTIAWPYAKQFFGEPLSALSLLLTFYGILAWRQHGRWPWLLVAGIGAATAVATVTAHAVLIAVLGGWWLVDWFVRGRPFGLPRLLLGLGAFAAPVIVAGLLLMAYNFARFGNPFDTGYHFDSGEGFNNPLLSGLWGLLFSPYRSVLLHTPLFLASLVGFVPFLRRHRSEGSVILLLSAALILLYSVWWMWWGGFAWGPRFLVPLTPFWVLVLAPLLERPVQAGAPAQRLRTRWIVYAVATVSFVVQLAAVSVNFVNYEIALRSIYPTDWSNPLAFGPPAQALTAFFDSPVFGQFKLMQESFIVNTDLAWLRADGTVLWLLLGVGAAAIITLIGLMTVWWIYTEDNLVDYHASWPMVVLVALLPLLVIGAWLGETSHDPHYGNPETGYRAALHDLCAIASGADALVNVVSNGYQIPMNWMPSECATPLPVYGYAPNSLRYPETEQVLRQVGAENDRIFFITFGVQASDPDNTVEQWLANNAFKATDDWYDTFRLVQYATPLRLTNVAEQPINKALLGRRAEQVTIVSARAPSVAPAGKPIPIEITYRLEAPTDQNLRWFVQLLSDQNIPLALLDTGPDDNYQVFSALPAQQNLVERAGLLVPANTPQGEYRLIAGLSNPDDAGARLITIDGPDWIELGTMRVVGSQAEAE
jgi:hypothetical protein